MLHLLILLTLSLTAWPATQTPAGPSLLRPPAVFAIPQAASAGPGREARPAAASLDSICVILGPPLVKAGPSGLSTPKPSPFRHRDTMIIGRRRLPADRAPCTNQGLGRGLSERGASGRISLPLPPLPGAPAFAEMPTGTARFNTPVAGRSSGLCCSHREHRGHRDACSERSPLQ